jgi:PiT family inorganic phosphate transporter
VDPLLVLALVFGFYMAWSIGANDVANSMADAVGSRAIGVGLAVVLASIFEFGGALLAGNHVADTVRSGIIDPEAFALEPRVLAAGLVCALLASAAWLNLASFLGLPVSTTHSIVGAIAGFGILRAGVEQVQWSKISQIVLSWFVSPVVGGVIACVVFVVLSRTVFASDRPLTRAKLGVPVCTFFVFGIVSLGTIYKGLNNLNIDLTAAQSMLISGGIGLVAAIGAYLFIRKYVIAEDGEPIKEQLERLERVFAVLVVISSCSVAFSHGANDVANAIGPLAGVMEIQKTGAISTKVGVDFWVLAFGGIGIVAGLSTYGYRVMSTVGTKITELTPSRGVAADIGATITVLSATRLGLPISTTHVLVGAIIGVGLARGITAIDRRVVMNIFFSWISTLPIVAVLTMLLFFVLGPMII